MTLQHIFDSFVGKRETLKLPITGGLSAGNVPLSIKVPSNERWKLKYGFIYVVTDATVANRNTGLEIYNEIGTGEIVLYGVVSATITASSIHYMNYSQTYQACATDNVNANNTRIGIGQGIDLFEGYTLKIPLNGGVAGDQFKAVFCVVKRKVIDEDAEIS